MSTSVPRVSDTERLRRWRLVLGGGDDGTGVGLQRDDARIDAALAAVYDQAPSGGRPGGRSGGLGRSAPMVTRWLGDIRRYFPTPVVQVLQRDAIERHDLRRLLLEPELLESVEPDVHLAALVVELSALLPDETRDTARRVVAAVVDELRLRLHERTRQAVRGALSRAERTRRPRGGDIDWPATIRANLRHWLPEQRTVVPERLVGLGRRQRGLARDVIVAIDQSGSMATSVVYAAVYGAVLASMPTLRTSVVAFDTEVVDLTRLAVDPVEVLFAVQLGGGTDIGRALAYCRGLVTRPRETVLFVVSDLDDGADPTHLVDRFATLTRAGVTVVVLLALSDDGTPAYDRRLAAELADEGVVVMACTPDAFPDLLARALDGRLIGSGAGGTTGTAPR